MLEFNGKSYARVSDILKPFVDFGRIDEEVLNRKAALGTRVHDAIKQEIQGGLPVLPIQERGYFQSFHKWVSAISPIFVESEMRYYNDERMLTGCIDALIKLHGEEKAVLIDFKTSVSESRTVWEMQAHLYHYLLTSAGKQLAPHFLFVKLDRYGGLPSVFNYKFDNHTLSRCLKAVDDYWDRINVPIKS